MSAISSLGSGAASQALEQLRQRFKAGGGRPPQPSAEQKAQFESAAKAAGIDTEKLSGLSDQIQQAVQGALQGSGGTGDPREGIESAVNTVLKDNGIDPDDLKRKLKTVGEKLGYGQGPGGFGGPPGGFAGPGGPGGPPGAFGGIGAPSSFSSASRGNSASQNQQLQSLFDAFASSQSKGEGEEDGSSVLSYLRNLPSGSLVDSKA